MGGSVGLGRGPVDVTTFPIARFMGWLADEIKVFGREQLAAVLAMRPEK